MSLPLRSSDLVALCVQHGIVQEPDPQLRQPSRPVSHRDRRIARAVWEDLSNVLTRLMDAYSFGDSAGISAVQLGIPLRLCVIWLPESGFTKCANPCIVSGSVETDIAFEGCLSFFDKRGRVPRPRQVTASYLNAKFQPMMEDLRGTAARILQHEIDHMNGILYVDRMLSDEPLIDFEHYAVSARKRR